MKILGLTGSVGMGKSETAKMLRMLGIPVFDADKAVHTILANNKTAIAAISKLAPDTVTNGKVDRTALGRKIFVDASLRKKLEAILHPLVRTAENKFLAFHRAHRARIVVLDIPLLFETKADLRCDAVMVVTATHFIQAQRVLKRPGMTQEKFAAILKAQMPDGEKRARADFIIHTGLGKQAALCQIRRALHIIRKNSCPPSAKSRSIPKPRA